MVLGAILVVGAGSQSAVDIAMGPSGQGNDDPEALLATAVLEGPLACAEILGRSMVERAIERFFSADVDVVSVLVDASVPSSIPPYRRSFDNVKTHVVQDVGFAIADTLKDYSDNGIDHAFVAQANAYTECDLIDFFQFHRGARQISTRIFDRNGALDLWVVDCAKANQQGLTFVPSSEADHGRSPYFVSDYVNRLAHPRDLRRLVVDAFHGRCQMRPSGREVRPGVWIEEGAQIHKRARIVAPAYVGREARIREDALITRCSNVESLCCIDYGTVIEDSSILSNSYVGIWLDVSHAVVQGNRLMNISRDVLLEISDSSVIRENVAVHKEERREPVMAAV